MSQRALSWGLWVVLVATVPMPYFMIETGRVPVAQLFLLAGLTVPLVISEPSFTTRFIAALFLFQSILYGAVLYIVARYGARWIARHAPQRSVLVLALLAGLLVAVSLCDVYRAPLSHGPQPTNLIGVFH